MSIHHIRIQRAIYKWSNYMRPINTIDTNRRIISKSSHSSSNNFNKVCILTLGRWTRTTFPVTVSPNVQINTLYDTGTARSCMSDEIFISLDVYLDDKLVPHVCTTSGTDMGALGYTTLDFQIKGHSFTQQFIVC